MNLTIEITDVPGLPTDPDARAAVVQAIAEDFGRATVAAGFNDASDKPSEGAYQAASAAVVHIMHEGRVSMALLVNMIAAIDDHQRRSDRPGSRSETDGPRGERYPLWCVDCGDGWGDERYHLCESQQAAERKRDALDGGDAATVRRCRRLAASEAYEGLDVVHVLSLLYDKGEVTDDAWDDCGASTTATLGLGWDADRASSREGADKAIWVWADEYIVVDKFVCEGDEL